MPYVFNRYLKITKLRVIGGRLELEAGGLGVNLAKIHIKLGALEVSCEASEQFIASDLMLLIQSVSELDIPDLVSANVAGRSAESWGDDGRAPAAERSKLSTTDFAVKMGAKSGSDLVMAAAAYLHHTQGQEEFRRSDILAQMKSAKAFYRGSYGSNLSKSLDMLTKSGRLGNPRPEYFSLPYAEIEATKNLLRT